MMLFFWILVFVVVYTYAGYGILLSALNRLMGRVNRLNDPAFLPEVTLVVPCFNERQVLKTKLENSFALDYPKDRLKIIFITDGSDDGSDTFLKDVSGITLLHQPERRGKAEAENRALRFVDTPFVIFTDANTDINASAIRNMIRHFADERVGVVSGEKRIAAREADTASASGEGFYWRYESRLKKLDSDFYSAVGAAGELIAFRTSLIEPLEPDTVLDDFVQSMRISLKGYRNIYEPDAYAEEAASANVKEELKRKIRISAGSWQAMCRLPQAFNPLHDIRLCFLFISHKVFRWVLVPAALVILLPLTTWMGMSYGGVYAWFALMQAVFYLLVLTGKYFEERKVKVRLFFIPYYFAITNWCLVLGFFRFLKGGQKATWERSRRMGEAEAEF